MKKELTFKFILYLTFLFGGVLQLTGVLTNTICTFFSAAILIFFNLLSKKKQKKNLRPYLYFILLISISTALNSTNYFLAILYVAAFVLVPYAINTFINNNAKLINSKKLINFFMIIGLLQLPIVFLQQQFAFVIVALSGRPLDPEDGDFGTFFYANDHALCFLILSLLTYLLFNKTHLNRNLKIFSIIWFCLTIITVHSNISFLLLFFVLTSYFVTHLNSKKMVILFLVFLIGTLTVTFLPKETDVSLSKVELIYNKIFNKDYEAGSADRMIERGIGDRSDIFLYFASHKFKITGEGPYNYYNPIKKEFPLFKNFSQYLWFYNDLGILGVIGIIYFYITIYRRHNKKFSYRIIYLILILVYSYFANTLSDLAFNITFCLFNLMIPTYRTKKIIQNEHRLHTVS